MENEITVKNPRKSAFLACTASISIMAVLIAAATRLFADSYTVADPFAGANSPWSTVTAAGSIVFPLLLEFLCAYVFAYSPLCAVFSLAVICVRAWQSAMFFPAISDHGGAGIAFFCAQCVCGALLAVFCAVGVMISPRLRTVSFSSLSGRREAAVHTVIFLCLSGGAAVISLLFAAIFHFSL